MVISNIILIVKQEMEIIKYAKTVKQNLKKMGIIFF